MKKTLLLNLLLFVMLKVSAQQDNQISQYIFNGIYINPAYSGYKEDPFVQSYVRMQWAGITGAPKSFSVSADAPFNANKFGLGVILSHDQIGAQSIQTAYFNYAYRIRIGEDEDSRLAFGLSAGVMQLGLDGNMLQAINPVDMALPGGSRHKIIPDANVGMFYSSRSFFAGVSVTNILARAFNQNQSTELLLPIPQPHLYVTGGAIIRLDDTDGIKFKPVFLYKDDFNGPSTLDINGIFMLNQRISIGGFYRASMKLYTKQNLQKDLPGKTAMGALAEFFATPNIRVGYSYDHALNELGNYGYGSHEISVGIYLKPARVNSAVRCYKF